MGCCIKCWIMNWTDSLKYTYGQNMWLKESHVIWNSKYRLSYIARDIKLHVTMVSEMSNDKISLLGSTLTHWGRVTHIWVGKLTIVGSNNGLSPGRRQTIIWANAAILLIGPLETNFIEILNELQTLTLKKIRLKISSVKCCPFRLGLNVLTLNLLDAFKMQNYIFYHFSTAKLL